MRQICNVKTENVATVRSNELLAPLEIDDLDVILREKMICWFGHVERSSGAIVKTPTERDRREWNLNKVDPCDRDVWRSSVRSAMRVANHLPGKKPTDVDYAPASGH